MRVGDRDIDGASNASGDSCSDFGGGDTIWLTGTGSDGDFTSTACCDGTEGERDRRRFCAGWPSATEGLEGLAMVETGCTNADTTGAVVE